MSEERIKKRNTFLMQGSILAMAGILVRIIGLIYRIPMINIIGTKGNGYYTSAYSVYSLFLILSSYSFPTAISKILSERLAEGRFKDAKNVIRISLLLSVVVGFIMFAIMYFGADIISTIHRKPLLSFALRALAPTLFIMAILSILRGVFQGMGNMIPTAVSQIFEQIANAIASIVFAYILFKRGEIANLIYESEEYSYAFGARGGAIGTGVGAFVALIVLVIMFRKLHRKFRKFLNNNNYIEVESSGKILNVLFTTMVPIIISSTIYNITSVVDDLLFSNVLTIMKSELNIVVLWGIFGNYHLLFNIPVAVSNALTSSIIPSISSSVAVNDVREVVLKTKYSIKYTMLIVIPSFIGLFILADPICKALFKENIDMLISVLRVGSIAVVFFSLSTVTIGVLQGLGHYSIPLKNSLIAFAVHIVACLILLVPFNLNIFAIVYSMIIFALTLSILNQRAINKIVRYNNPRFRRRYILTFFLMTLSAVIMGIVTYMLNSFLANVVLTGASIIFIWIRLIICVAVAITIYMFLVVLLGVVRKKDALYMPFISRFSRILRG
ncbi:MAG: polysaccharide biosynthesis protein [Lachnospiraceae bacterium]|nr:polysaccharide biosynthesis protein [Lachnospiraceae bacterium]